MNRLRQDRLETVPVQPDGDFASVVAGTLERYAAAAVGGRGAGVERRAGHEAVSSGRMGRGAVYLRVGRAATPTRKHVLMPA